MMVAAIGIASIFRVQVMSYTADPGSGRASDEMARSGTCCNAGRRLR